MAQAMIEWAARDFYLPSRFTLDKDGEWAKNHAENTVYYSGLSAITLGMIGWAESVDLDNAHKDRVQWAIDRDNDKVW